MRTNLEPPRAGVTLALFAALLAGSASAQPPALSAEARRITAAIPNEDGVETDRPYILSNEWGHRLFFPHVRGLGGVLVGVGADQTYTMAAASGAEMIVAVDYDPTVRLVHRMYSALLEGTASPDALLARFEEDAEEETAAQIASRLEGDPDRRAVVRLYRRYRNRLSVYLDNLRRWRHGDTWLNDDAMFAHVRALHAAGRVIPRTGDVTGATTMRAVGDAIRRMGLTVRTVYFSNAEMFFPNTPRFVANVRNLPTDERTVLLRTVHHDRLPDARFGRWHYVVQPFGDYLARLATGHYLYANSVVEDLIRTGRRGATETQGLSILDGSVPMRTE